MSARNTEAEIFLAETEVVLAMVSHLVFQCV